MKHLTKAEQEQRIEQIKIELKQNFGANLLVEKEFSAVTPSNHITID